MKMIVAVAYCLSAWGLLAQSPFADAEFYLRGPVDRDGDGFLSTSAGEWLDVFHAGDLSDSRNVSKSNAQTANLRAATIRNEKFVDPYTQCVYPNVPCLWMSGAPSTSQEGTALFQPTKVTLPTASFKYSYTNDYTFTLLWRADGNLTSGGSRSDYHTILNLGNGWGSPIGRGFKFGYRYFNGNDCRYMFSFGGVQPKTNADPTISGVGTNEWLCLVGVLDGKNQEFRFYQMRRGVVTTKVCAYPDAASSSTVEPVSTAQLGEWNPTEPTAWPSSANTCLGSIARLAVWGRALSEDEILEVMHGCAPNYWRFGEADGTANEFATTTDATVCTNGQTWASLPNSITSSGKAFKLAFPLDPVQTITPSNPAPTLAALVKMSSDSGSGVLRPVLNGHDLKDLSVSPRRTELLLLDSEYLQEKDNVLELKHVSGGSMKVDFVEGGLNGWNVGYENDSSGLDGFRSQTANLYTLGTAWSLFPRCITGPGNDGAVPLNFCVNIQPDLVGKCRYMLDIRMKHQGVNATVENAVAVLDENQSVVEVVKKFSLKGWQTYSIRLPERLLKAGKNYFRVYRSDGVDRGANDWDDIDFLRFYPVPPSQGMMLIVR